MMMSKLLEILNSLQMNPEAKAEIKFCELILKCLYSFVSQAKFQVGLFFYNNNCCNNCDDYTLMSRVCFVGLL